MILYRVKFYSSIVCSIFEKGEKDERSRKRNDRNNDRTSK